MEQSGERGRGGPVRGAGGSRADGWRNVVRALGAGLLSSLLALGGGPTGVHAQELADFDYENLSLRGAGLYLGGMWADRVDATTTVGLRADLGYLGPGVRIVPSVTWWSSSLGAEEVAELEASVERLVDRESPPGTPPADVNLGTVDWSDLALGLDAHMVWSVPFDLLTFAGAGVAVHFLNGDGEAVSGTFVEDLLDGADAGFNLHGGVEAPISESVRLWGEARFEILQDLKYGELRFGAQLMWGPSAPGEPGGG